MFWENFIFILFTLEVWEFLIKIINEIVKYSRWNQVPFQDKGR